MIDNMTIKDGIRQFSNQLQAAGIDSARLDVLLLISDEFGRDKSWVLAHDEEKLTPGILTILGEKVTERECHIPLAYIRGKTEFYGREFAINRKVLVPRPESEALIVLLKEFCDDTPCQIVDVGTGSGCLAVTAAIELPNAKVYATDIDESCLDLASQNASNHSCDVSFARTNLVERITDHLSANLPLVLLCNLPYVPEGYPVNEAASHEPKLALFSGLDGLDHYRSLFAQIEMLQERPIAIITESLQVQHHALATLAREHGYLLEKTEGLAQRFAWDGINNR